MQDGSKLDENEKSLRFDVFCEGFVSSVFCLQTGWKKGNENYYYKICSNGDGCTCCLYEWSQIKFLKTWTQSNASLKQADNPMQFQRNQTIQCNFKASKQSKAILK